MKKAILFIVIGIFIGFGIVIMSALILGFKSYKDMAGKAPSKVVESNGIEKIEYIQNFIEIYKIRAEWRKLLLKEKCAYVSGKIKNNGDQTLKRVEITIYFLDKNNNAIFEERHHPVLAGGIFTDEPPLKPNYIQNFSYYSEDCPSEWAEGKVKIGITDIEFEEQKEEN